MSDVLLVAGSDAEGALGAGRGAGGVSQPLFRRSAAVFAAAIVAAIAGIAARSKIACGAAVSWPPAAATAASC